MDVVIRAEGFLPTDTLREHILRRLRTVGRTVRSRIRSVRVLLLPGTDIGSAGNCSGPKCCTLMADVVGMGTVEVNAQDCDLYRAVGRAAVRLAAHFRRGSAASRRALQKSAEDQFGKEPVR
jgi:ribosome-associated translation inhibitor RaiA